MASSVAVLPKSPLVYVVAQVRVNQIELIQKYIPAIQDDLRHKGYPRYTAGEISNIRVIPTGPQITTSPRFEFQDRDRRSGIVVTKDAVAYHVSRYSRFDDFCRTMKLALASVHSSVGLELVERIGLRYVNLVRAKDAGFSGYLDPALLGIHEEKFGARNSTTTSQMIAMTDVGTIAIRLHQRSDGGFLTPDLDPSSLDHGDVSIAPGEKVSLLDFDHFKEYTAAQDFSIEAILETFVNLHGNIEQAFHAAVTEQAIQEWSRC